jgi:hypothetical protein
MNPRGDSRTLDVRVTIVTVAVEPLTIHSALFYVLNIYKNVNNCHRIFKDLHKYLCISSSVSFKDQLRN